MVSIPNGTRTVWYQPCLRHAFSVPGDPPPFIHSVLAWALRLGANQSSVPDSNPALLSFLLLFPSLISSRLDSSYALSLEPAGKPISVPVMQIVWCSRSFHSWFTYKVHRRSAAAGREAGCPFFFLVLIEGTGGDSGVTASIKGVDFYVGARPVSIP